MKKAVKVLLVTSTVLILSGCGINSGTITEKVVEPERHYTTTTYVNKVPIISWHTDDADYCLSLTEGDESGYVCVDKETFDSANIGDYYTTE